MPEIDLLTPSETQGEDDMSQLPSNAADISPTGREILVSEGLAAHQTLMTESKGNIIHDNGLLRKIALKKFDEVGSIESRAVDKVLDNLGE